MKDITKLLRDGDPAANEPGLSPQAAADIRRAMLNEAPSADAGRYSWHQALALAAMVALTVATAVIGGRPSVLPQPATGRPTQAAMPDNSERRQIQFATPGGTRIIWVFDSEFQVKETLP